MEKIQRPKRLDSVSVKVETSCGNLYVHLTFLDGSILEVFAVLGKAGGCATCQLEGITRAVSIGLRYGVPATEYVRALRGIQCPVPRMFPPEDRVLSCPDAVAKVLEDYCGGREGVV